VFEQEREEQPVPVAVSGPDESLDLLREKMFHGRFPSFTNGLKSNCR
jgi:hypothetical protein